MDAHQGMSSPALRTLYQDLVKAASSFKDTNFRKYFLRIAEDDFAKFGKSGLGEAEFLSKQKANLEVLQRQTAIQNMYFTESFSVKR